MAQPLFPKGFNPHRNEPKAPMRRLYAKFPDGTEAEVVKRVRPVSGGGAVFEVKTPRGDTESNNLLRDLKFWLERDFPGIAFERRA